TTPDDASLPARMIVMKAWFVGFDLATLGLVITLLRFTGRPVGWSLAYGWCPLVIKEFAHSGHLDALAVFLTMLALSLAVRARFVLWPMLPRDLGDTAPETAPGVIRDEVLPPLPPWESFSEPPAPEAGVAAFASEWEMNDFLFLILMENVRPYAQVPPHERAW